MVDFVDSTGHTIDHPFDRINHAVYFVASEHGTVIELQVDVIN